MEGHQGTQWVHDLPQTTVIVGQSFEPFKRLVLLRGPITRSFIETGWFREKGLPRRHEGVARLYSRHLYEYVCI